MTEFQIGAAIVLTVVLAIFGGLPLLVMLLRAKKKKPVFQPIRREATRPAYDQGLLSELAKNVHDQGLLPSRPHVATIITAALQYCQDAHRVHLRYTPVQLLQEVLDPRHRQSGHHARAFIRQFETHTAAK